MTRAERIRAYSLAAAEWAAYAEDRERAARNPTSSQFRRDLMARAHARAIAEDRARSIDFDTELEIRAENHTPSWDRDFGENV